TRATASVIGHHEGLGRQTEPFMMIDPACYEARSVRFRCPGSDPVLAGTGNDDGPRPSLRRIGARVSGGAGGPAAGLAARHSAPACSSPVGGRSRTETPVGASSAAAAPTLTGPRSCSPLGTPRKVNSP